MSEPVNLIWSVPDGDALVAKMARVSNPQNESNDATACRLIRYLIKNKHWSPFEMVSMCVEIKTTRDISRQILRHRSFVFQERPKGTRRCSTPPPPAKPGFRTYTTDKTADRYPPTTALSEMRFTPPSATSGRPQ